LKKIENNLKQKVAIPSEMMEVKKTIEKKRE
jgi:hypothetical protein